MKFGQQQRLVRICLMLTLICFGCGRDNTHSTSAGGSTATPQGTESSAGGGNAVVCFNNANIPSQIRAAGGVVDDATLDQIKSIEMLDLYRAKLPRDASSKLLPEIIDLEPNEAVDHYIHRIAERAGDYVPTILDLIDVGRSHFPGDLTYFPLMSGLRKINDANLVENLAPECLLLTMAAQLSTGQRGELALDQRLFFHKLHSKLSQAVLLLHEYLYVMARANGQTDSRGVRELISHLIVKTPKTEIGTLMALTDALRGPNAEPAQA